MKAPALPGESILCHGVSAHREADPSLSIPARDTRLQCHTVTTFLQVARTYVYLYVVFSMWYVLWLLKSNGLNNPGKNMKAAILTKQTKNQGCSPVHGTMASLIPPWTQESNPYKGTALRGAPASSPEGGAERLGGGAGRMPPASQTGGLPSQAAGGRPSTYPEQLDTWAGACGCADPASNKPGGQPSPAWGAEGDGELPAHLHGLHPPVPPRGPPSPVAFLSICGHFILVNALFFLRQR